MNEIAATPLSIGALTDFLTTPSSRFRVHQLIPHLEARGIRFINYPRRFSSENQCPYFKDRRIRESFVKLGYALGQEVANVAQTAGRLYSASRHDYTFVSRELVIGYATFEKLIPNRLIYDIDDAIFLNGFRYRDKTKLLVQAASVVFAANHYLADWCRAFSKNVHVLPTAVDIARFVPQSKPHSPPFVIGWSGTSSSFKYLVAIQDSLLRFFRAYPDTVFFVCSDRFPSELEKLRNNLRFELWSQDKEVSQIQSFDIGIMPIAKDDWALGKASYKMLLYLSCNIPCCVTSWGMNAEILKQGQVGIGVDDDTSWFDALEYLYLSRLRFPSLFPDCRSVVENHYSLNSIADIFVKCLSGKSFTNNNIL